MRTVSGLGGGVLVLLLAGCYDPPIPHVPPQTSSGKLEVVAADVRAECMRPQMTQNLVSRGFKLVPTDAPNQFVADKDNTRAVYTITQEGPNVRVLADLYEISRDGKIVPVATKEVTQRRHVMLQMGIESFAKNCRGRSPMGSDTFSIKDLGR